MSADFSAPRNIGPRRPPRELPISTLQAFDNVQAVRAALVALDQGQFAQAAMLQDAMMADGHILAKLGDRVAGLFGSPLRMRPPRGREEDQLALEVAEDAELLWEDLTADSAERAVARDGLMLGAGLAEVVVTPTADEWSLQLQHWHARHLAWRWDTRSYWVTTTTGQEELQPDGRGGFFSTWMDASGAARVSRWLLHTPFGYQRGWAQARIKALAVPWLLRMWALRDWGRHSEQLGIPPKKVSVPSAWNDEEKRRALSEVASLASEGVILVPKKDDGTGFDVDLMELKGPNAAETFDQLVERAEAAISVALVGQTLTTQASAAGGNRALGEVHERVQQRLLRDDASSMSRAVRRAVLQPWAEWNYGDPDVAPVPTWEVEPPEDQKTKGEGMKALGDGLAALKAAGIPVDRAAVCSDAGIPLEEGVEFDDPPPPPVPPSSPDAALDDEGDGAPADDDEQEEQLSRLQVASRRRKAAVQGQVYADAVADAARARARRILAGDVRALLRVVEELQPAADGGLDVHALRQRLLEVYRAMSPDRLARLTERALILAELSGRYAVQKEI